MSDDLEPLVLSVCGLCRRGAGGECHTPGCAFWMNRAPDVPLAAVLSRGEMIEAGQRAILSRWPNNDPRCDAEAVLTAAGVIAAKVPA